MFGIFSEAKGQIGFDAFSKSGYSKCKRCFDPAFTYAISNSSPSRCRLNGPSLAVIYIATIVIKDFEATFAETFEDLF